MEYFENMPLLSWSKIKSQGDVYTPRTGHEVVVHEDKIYLFGGTDDDQRKNDLYCYDIYKNKWEMLKENGDVPSKRSGSRGITYKNALYFFGGYLKKSDEYYNDLYKYDLNEQAWIYLEPNNTPPPPRTDHTATLYKHYIFIFGGFDGSVRDKQNQFGSWDEKKSQQSRLVF